MADWTELLAEGLRRDPLDARDTDRLLLAAKDVAHRVERKQTPLATYLVGEFVGRRMTEGASRMDALTEAMTQLHGLLPESSPPDAS